MSSRNNRKQRNRSNNKKNSEDESLIAKVSKEFAESTSMHGLKFIAAQNSSLEERSFPFFNKNKKKNNFSKSRTIF